MVPLDPVYSVNFVSTCALPRLAQRQQVLASAAGVIEPGPWNCSMPGALLV
jgi:hypothetical protein